MKVKIISLVLPILFLIGCAQVPKESVELSSTLGRDIAATHKAHIQLATILFSRMKQDVNRFIDETYAPYQIKNVMEKQKLLADSKDKKSLLLLINAAFKPGSSEKLQGYVLQAMSSLVTNIHNDVEKMRSDLLTPLNEQEAEALGSINRAYQQMHYANSIVTGHLSSIAKVHDAQSDLLAEFGVERDLRKEMSEKMATVSVKINSLVNKASKAESKLDSAEDAAASLKSTIAELKNKLTKIGE